MAACGVAMRRGVRKRRSTEAVREASENAAPPKRRRIKPTAEAGGSEAVVDLDPHPPAPDSRTDSRRRCPWLPKVRSPIYERYHDEEWGNPVYDDGKLFEMIILESQQVCEKSMF